MNFSPHLSARVPGHIDPAEEDLLVVLTAAPQQPPHLLAPLPLPAELAVDGGVVLLVHNVVDAVPVDQQVLLMVSETCFIQELLSFHCLREQRLI